MRVENVALLFPKVKPCIIFFIYVARNKEEFKALSLFVKQVKNHVWEMYPWKKSVLSEFLI